MRTGFLPVLLPRSTTRYGEKVIRGSAYNIASCPNKKMWEEVMNTKAIRVYFITLLDNFSCLFMLLHEKKEGEELGLIVW